MSDVLTPGWPDRLLSLADWESLPVDETHHVECSEGVLVVTPKPTPRHQWAVVRLAEMLNRQLPDTASALADVDVLLPGHLLTVRAPDVVVTPSAVIDDNPPRIPAADVRLAVEILSEGSRRIDQVTKMAEYAEAGIPDYWIVDLVDRVSLRCYRTAAPETYDVVGRFVGVVELRVAETLVQLDLDQLSRR